MSVRELSRDLKMDEAITPGSRLYADLNRARGDYNRANLMRALGMNATKGILEAPPQGRYILFGGHRGCGKSTELLAISRDLEGEKRFLVVSFDAPAKLDIHNFCYADLAIGLVEELCSKLKDIDLGIPDVFLDPLRDWFKEIIKLESNETSLGLSTEATLQAKLGMIISFCGKLTTHFRNNSSSKKEIREKIRNNFSNLAEHFNGIMTHVQDQIKKENIGLSVLFVVDGLDRLPQDQATEFFIHNINQLRSLQLNVIICAPINILNESGQISQNFDDVFRLPMIKLSEKHAAEQIEPAWAALREFATKRVPLETFDWPETLDLLIAQSGGHPRDLLRLLNFCLLEIDEAPISRAVAEKSILRLSSEYKRVVQPDDFKILVEIDRNDKTYVPATEQSRRLLYNLALLEYNDYWWRTHPAVQSLPAYKKALDELCT